ncbi:MAG: translation elongation factor 4 [Patescibacteria group bacterium]|nr:translation elongation factor 4 [Patescibacteria group bacterium]
MSNTTNHIRNFCIIAHIDHGKSTLADCFLELTQTVSQRDMKEQILDQMDLEREKGITIKLQPVRMKYKLGDQEYELNLIDTPGHVDFNYEVSRSLAAVEGAILLVDAVQGIQAQTLSNLYLALEQDLTIIPVINKIDLPNADVEGTQQEIMNLLSIKKEDILLVSAKTGQGVEQILKEVIKQVPPPQGEINKPFKALIFDSHFDEYKGVMAYIRVVDGQIKSEDKILMMASQQEAEVLETGIFNPKLKKVTELSVGEIGYLATGLKISQHCRVGDTVVNPKIKVEALPGYKEVKPMVFAGIYLSEGSNFNKLRESLEKLQLNDAALTFEPDYSQALGHGFSCGFLGLLHLEIIQERLKREYNLKVIITTPSVAYHVKLKNGQQLLVHRPQEMPEPTKVESVQEPWMKVDIITPEKYLGPIMELVTNKNGEYISTEYLDHQVKTTYQRRVILHYDLPLNSLIRDFYDKLKSVSSGYASLNYEFNNYRSTEIIKLDILISEEKMPALSALIYKDSSFQEARQIVQSLKNNIPRQMFEIKIQAVINSDDKGGGKIIASERIAPMRKDVTAKLYGGDVTRKRKLLAKQKKGKQKMRQMGRVNIPPEAYLAMFKR